jgi:phage terminase large subunit
VISSPEVEQKVYRPRGAAWELFYKYKIEEYDEVLFEGVAGGGKSLAYAMFIHRACLMYPGIQVLMVRKYRDTMSESCMKTYEEEVLKHHMPEVCEGRDRTQRAFYQYPYVVGHANASRVVCVGITDEEKIKSTAWDLVWLNEGTEVTVAAYETLFSRLRPGGARVSPYSCMLIDCNPSYAGHFLNQRFMPETKSEKTTRPIKRLRLITKHTDNPTYWNEEKGEWTEDGARYMAKLDANTGARRERLYLGKWCTEEGLVYDEFDPSYHVIRRADLPTIEYYFGSVDWGFRNAGVIQMWGVDARGAMYLVHETYRTQQTIDFWAEEAVKLYAEFRPVAYVCDPARADLRVQFNDRLSRFKGGKVSRIAIEANNDHEGGIQEMKSALTRDRHSEKCGSECFREDRHGKAKMYFVDDALRNGRDPLLSAERGHSVCTVDEIQNLVWLKTADGRPIKEKWDDSIPHDGLDAARYAAMFNFKRNAPKRKNKNPYPPGTVGHRMWASGTRIAQMG